VREPRLQDLRTARVLSLPGLLGRDVLGVQLFQPRRVVPDTIGLFEGHDLRRGQLVADQVIIVIPQAAQTAATILAGHTASGWLLVALGWFRRLSLPCRALLLYLA
jgi:hypothetical protein